MFYTPNLLGGSVEFDVDLSNAGCSCNIAFYLVKMPAKGWNGVPSAQGGNYYCDANDVGGAWCPEIDIMEANKYAFQATPHKCDPPTDKGHYTNCDKSGKGWMNLHNLGASYGPGKSIDTNKWFHVKAEFKEEGGKLTGYGITLEQNGHSFSHMTTAADVPAGYLDSLTWDVQYGMTFALTSWGSDWNTMKWLDGNTGC